MNVLVAAQARGFAGRSTVMARGLCDALRAQGMRVFLDSYDDRQLQYDEALQRRVQNALLHADAMILVLEDAASFPGSRLQRQWLSYEKREEPGLFAVYASNGAALSMLPPALADRYYVPDAPGAAEHLAAKLAQSMQRLHPTREAAADAPKKKRRGARAILFTLLALLLLAGCIALFSLWSNGSIVKEEAAPSPSPQELSQQDLEAYEQAQRTMQVTIIEGSTVESIAAQLEEQIAAQGGTFSAQNFLSLCKSGEGLDVYPFVVEVLQSEKAAQRKYVLEGYLFPDTYEIFVHTDEKTVIEKMLTRFSEIIARDDVSQAIEQSAMTLPDLLALASVVEKEGTGESFTKISAVFANRLQAGMPLQSDVTAQYASGKSALTMTTEDVSIDSPYNTYRVTGLPVGPICNPGAAAIKAAALPDAEYVAQGYYYFLLTDPATGVIAYSKTYDEHAALAQQYAPLWAAYDVR